MAYYLGVDLGTTYTAAAVWRDGRVEIANLGTRAAVIPSVVLLRDDGTILTGEAAARRALTEPQRVAREFKRRFGDTTPIIVGGTPYSADALTAKLLRWVVDSVAEREGGPASAVVVSHPANWGLFKQDLLQQTIRLADLDHTAKVTTITEPEAAAIHYASQERADVGSIVAIYDLGGGTFDAAVLRRTADGWEILGQPEGVERLGGVDVDDAVFNHVKESTGDALERLDPDDPAAVVAVARLRQECIEAKEALASDVDTTIPVVLPNFQADVRLTRAELEDMIRPLLADSVAALRRALRSAEVEPDDVSAVLLVGGSSRIPLVAQLVGSELRRPVAVDAHPKHGVALGAAIVAAERGTGGSVDTEIIPSIEIFEPAPLGRAPVAAPGPAPPAALAGASEGAASTTAPVGAGPTAPPASIEDAGSASPTAPSLPGLEPASSPRQASASAPAGAESTSSPPVAPAGVESVSPIAPAKPPSPRPASAPGRVVVPAPASPPAHPGPSATAPPEVGVSSRPGSAPRRPAEPPQRVMARRPPSPSSGRARAVPGQRQPSDRWPLGYIVLTVLLVLAFAAVAAAIIARPMMDDDGDPATTAVTLSGSERWTNSGVTLQAGDDVKVTAEGAIFDDVTGHPDRSFDPNGIVDELGEHTADPYEDINHAALVGRIGQSGDVFELGAETTFAADNDGELFLTINDSRLDDNRGTYEVEITVQD